MADEAKVAFARRERRARSRQVTCSACHAAFVSTRQDAEFCSSRCRQKHYRRQKAASAAVREQVANLVASLIG